MIWELALQPHPATPCPAIHTLNSTVERLADGGLRQASEYERAALTGMQWQSIELALQTDQPFPRTLKALAEPEVAQALKPQLRNLLQYHCGSTMLRTRQLMMDLQSL